MVIYTFMRWEGVLVNYVSKENLLEARFKNGLKSKLMSVTWLTFTPANQQLTCRIKLRLCLRSWSHHNQNEIGVERQQVILLLRIFRQFRI